MTDRIVGLVLVLFGVLVIAAAGDLPRPMRGMSVGSGTFPSILGGLVIAFAAWLVVRGDKKDTEPPPRVVSLRGIAGIALTLAYVLGFPFVGLIAATFALLVAYALLLQTGRPRWVDTLLVPAATTAGVYGLLRVLNVPLPDEGLFF